MILELFIPGVPVPGGSKKAFALRRKDGSLIKRANGSPVINITDDAGERNKVWRQVIASSVAQVFKGKLLTMPLAVEMHFRFQRPISHYRKERGQPTKRLTIDAPRHRVQKPDVTKLTRAAEDALTGILWVDDAQIVWSWPTKSWCHRDEQPGLLLKVTPIDVDSMPPPPMELPLFEMAGLFK